MSGLPFLLDTNVFIEPKRKFYAFDICPGFWKFLEREFRAGSIFSINAVYNELQAGNDDLTTWSKMNLGHSCFFDEQNDDAVVAKYNEVFGLVNSNPQYYDYAKREFFKPDAADPWICAYAAIHPCTVITHEASDPNVRKRVPLANILDSMDTPYADIFSCLRELKAKFDLMDNIQNLSNPHCLNQE